MSVTGFNIPDNGLGERCRKAYEIIAANPDKRILFDIESGEPEIVSKEYHESYLKMLEDFMPKNMPEIKGKIICFGTSGNFEDTKSFEDIWKNLEQWK